MKASNISIGSKCRPTEQVDPRELGRPTFHYIDISSIDRDKKEIVSATEIAVDDAPSRARKLVRRGDVLVSTVRPNLNAVAIVPDEFDGEIASTGFCVLRAKERELKPRLLLYRTMTPDFISGLVSQMKGANYPAVSDREVKESTIPDIPFSEQQRIVEILDQADALRKKRAEADAKAARILPALFHQMFGDPATNPKGWQPEKLGFVIDDTSYGTSVAADPSGQGIPLIRMNNITTSGDLDLSALKYVHLEEGELRRNLLQPGELLFNRTNTKELVGKTGLWRSGIEAVAASYLIRVRIRRDRACPEYVWAWMNVPFLKQQLFDRARRAVGMANINTAELRSLPILVPPRSLQEKFSDLLKHVGVLNLNSA